MEHCSRSIGIFDSGLGGLTVMRQILEELPQESITYFGDTARVPYGNKSSDTILKYSIENSNFLIQKEVKALVVACNTASAYSLEHLQETFSIPVVGVIEPGVERALEATHNGHIAVLGTEGTIRSGAYQKQFARMKSGIQVTTIECPLFVPLVEEHFLSHPATKMIVKEYLAPLKGAGVDTVLLGCTHYPLLRSFIEEELGDDVTVIDSASSCSQKLRSILGEASLLANQNVIPKLQYYVSDDANRFKERAQEFLETSIDEVRTQCFGVNVE